LESDGDSGGLVGSDGDTGRLALKALGVGGVEGLGEEGAVGARGDVADEAAQVPLDFANSTTREDISEAETVTLTRVMSLAERACWVEAAN
jgi:hypothetical protein